uniref:UAS domain-containing protein n=1 Tax=Caenorhabditis tropicalis TaxID=1561998 RepID=A0A1I7V228_9PELO
MSSDEVLIVIQNFLSKPRPLGSFFTLGSGTPFDTLGILEQLGESSYFHENENCRVYPVFNSPYILLVRLEDRLVTGVIRRLDQLLDDEEKPRFSNWSDHIQRLGEGVPY